MTVLLVQTFLLLLGAFLLGASLACFLRRAFSGRHEEFEAMPGPSSAVTGAVPTAAVSAAASSLEGDRFGRALAGAQVPPVLQGPITGPVVEVQPPPEARAVPSVPAAEADSPPAAAEKSAPAPQPKPAGPTYTEIAVATAAAAAAAAAAAKAKAEQDAAEKKAKAEAEAAKAPPPDASPLPAPASEAPPAAPEAPPAASDAPPPAAPAVAPVTSETAPVSQIQGDDLTRIHSIDAALKDRLYLLGVRTFSAIAAWTPEDLRSLSQSLGFQARILEENWIEQAKILAKGGDPSGARLPAKKPVLDVIVPVGADRLHRIIGVDPASEAQLYANGVTRLAQIAGWSSEDAVQYEGLLGLQEGRIAREGWVDQARFLTRGDSGTPAPNQAPTAQGAAPPIPAVKATTVTVAERPPAPAAGPGAKDGLAGLRSVKSEALVGGAAASLGGDRVDDLKRIRGIGVLIEKKLNSIGVTAYEQVANWTGADIDRVSQFLDFKGRIERENWIEQSRILASGGQTEFSRRVDRGEA